MRIDRLDGGADDERDDPLLAVGTGDLLADLAAASHDDGAVGDLGHVIEGVRDDDDGVTLGAQAQDQVEDTTRLAHAERRGRLVEDDDLRGERRGPGDGDHLTLPARHQPDCGRAVGQRHLQSLEHVDGRIGHRAAAQHAQRSRQPTRAGVLAAGEEVGRRVEIVEQSEVLVDGLDPVGASRSR